MTFTDSTTDLAVRPERSAGVKFLFVLLVGFILAIPLMLVYALSWDRQNQSTEAQSSITQGWGDAQTLAGPLLVIPYQDIQTETVEEKGKTVNRKVAVTRQLFLAPQITDIKTKIDPTVRQRSIYQAVVYDAQVSGTARFSLPDDMARLNIASSAIDFSRAEIRFGISDPRGIIGSPTVGIGGKAAILQPGHGVTATGQRGFYAPIDAGAVVAGNMALDFGYRVRGTGSLTLVPYAGKTTWEAKSTWSNPSFQGSFLPESRKVDGDGFSAFWQVGNLALGQSLASTDDETRPASAPSDRSFSEAESTTAAANSTVRIDLVQPVDLYDQVNRATKYGFLFIGFTFVALLLFDVIGGVRISAPGYGLVGSGLVLFFVMLLALAEVIGFTAAYMLASAAIIGLITAYCIAILKSRKRAISTGAMLAGLYAALFILLSLEAYSLLIGSLLLFAALAGVMYATRNLDWTARRGAQS